MQFSSSLYADDGCTNEPHLCASPMKKPKKEPEISQKEEQQFTTINDKFAVNTLHDMWKSGQIYWNLGANVLMINPNRNITDSKPKHITSNTSISSNMLPFIQSISDNISHAQQNQSIIAIGAAGSGKTHTTQQVVSHFASQSTNPSLNLVDLWNNISTISTIFGSHYKSQNVESNGSANIIKLIYDSQQTLQGILCESLLWHKLIPSWIHTNDDDDVISGYFHIFALVIAHPHYVQIPLTDKIKQNDTLLSHKSPFNDGANVLQNAMNELMITSVAQKEILDVIYSILCLNQIGFSKFTPNINHNSSSSTVSITIHRNSLPFAKYVCEILKCDPKDLLQYLMTQTVHAQKQAFIRPHLSSDGAYKKIQRLCYILYECVVEWLFQHMDRLCLTAMDEARVSHFISVIDFPGYTLRAFVNDFDAFCTNFCNENLQQLFNALVLQSNQQKYVEDGLNWVISSIPDYSKVIDLIASPPNGIFQILTRHPNESQMLQKINEYHPFKRQLVTISKQYTAFTIHHYSGNVQYDIKEFTFNNNCGALQKNDDIITLLKKSKLNVIKTYLESNEQNTENAVNTLHFQLRNLIKVMKTTNMNHILCVNPSENNTDAHFSRDFVLSQIKSLSIVEMLRDAIHGYSVSFASEKLLNIYHKYCDQKYNLTAEQKCECILVLFGIPAKCYKFGLSKVFIKHSALKQLRELESLDSIQLNPVHKTRLMRYVQSVKIHKWCGSIKAYGRLNYRLQHQRVLDSIKNVVCIQKLMRKAYTLKEKSIGSIPIFTRKQNLNTNRKHNKYHDINTTLTVDYNIQTQLQRLYNNGCYYAQINEHITVYLNPYNLANFEGNSYNKMYLKKKIKKMRKQMMESDEAQLLMLHGDNSSGKSTNFFFISNYICNQDAKLREMLWASNQILISFCHTSSVHNVNTSRYLALRKFVFDANGSIKGVQHSVKLLSPFLCASSNDNCRNFHLLYEICNVLKNDSRFLLEKSSAFSCLNSNFDPNKYGMNDNHQFVYFLRALKILNISTSKQQQICRLCAAILHLSNIECDQEDNDDTQFNFSNFDKKFLFAAAYLLGIKMEQLCDILLPKSSQYFHATQNTQHKSQLAMQILYQRDVVTKALYELLFEYIQHMINQQFEAYFDCDANDGDKEFILVDIAGKSDDNIDNNRFGDLAANYAFDYIQKYINTQHITENEAKCMEEFEIYQHIKTHNNEERLHITDDRNGIISVLDYIHKHKYHKMDSGKMFHDMMQHRDYIETNDTKFILNHVQYNTQHTFDDTQPFAFEALMDILQNSSLSIARKLTRFYSGHKLFDFGQSFGHHRIHSVIKLYLNHIYQSNSAINHHYLLCIRPNTNQHPSEWDSILVEEQLKSLHIPQILHVKQLLMPYSLHLMDTANKLSIVFGDIPYALEMYAYNIALFIMALFTVFDIETSSYKIGKQLIFLRDEHTRDQVYNLLNFKPSLAPSKCLRFKSIYLQTKAHRVTHTLSAYIRLSTAWNTACIDSAKQQQRNAIEFVLNYTRFLSPIIKIAKLKVEKERIRRRKERERMKQEKLRELRRLEIEKKRLEQECELEKIKRKNELHHLEQKWQNIQQHKQSEIERIERETAKAIMETQKMADEQLMEVNESVFAHVNLKDNLSVDSSVIDAMVEHKHAPQYKQLYNNMYKIQQQIKQLELQKRESLMKNEYKAPSVQIIGSPKLNEVTIKKSAPPTYNVRVLDLNYIIHHYLDEKERKRAKEILKQLYKYKQDESNGKAVNPQTIFISIRSLIKNARAVIRYDLYKGFEELIYIKHMKKYEIILKEVKKCGINIREIIRSINERDVEQKITEIARNRVIDIADALHVNTLMERKRVIQYLYELDGILKNLPHKDYVDIIALVEMVVNEHNLPMFVHIFQPLRAQKEFLTKISFYFSDAMYKIFKILLDQMMDNMESDDHKSNLDSIYRDLAKIFVKLPHHVNMDEILSEFLLYFVPPDFVHRFHQITKQILSKRYEIIKISQKKAAVQNIPKQRIESEAQSEEYVNDHRLLKKLKKDIDRLRKSTAQNQENLQNTVYDQLQQQSRQTSKIVNKMDDLKYVQNTVPPPPQLNEDKLIQRVSDILDNKITETYPKIHSSRYDNDDGKDPYIKFVNGCFDQFDIHKTGKIPLDTMPKLLDLLDITGPKRNTLLQGFHDMCKLTEPQIYRHQYLSALQHTKGKKAFNINKKNVTFAPNVKELGPLPPPPPLPPSHMMMNRMNALSHKKQGTNKVFRGKQPAVIVLPEGKTVRYVNDDAHDMKSKQDSKAGKIEMHTPQIEILLKDKDSIHGWAMKKGDAFFKPNKKRYVILSSHFFYWCVSDTALYPKGGLNLHSSNVHASKHGTTLRIKSSQKERIFNFGDVRTATKFYDRIIDIQQNKTHHNKEIEID